MMKKGTSPSSLVSFMELDLRLKTGWSASGEEQDKVKVQQTLSALKQTFFFVFSNLDLIF